MRSSLFTLVLLCAPMIPDAAAGPLSCPDLAAAAQVGSCPTGEDLQYTFIGYCSDNARMYETDDTCSDYQRYRRLKNVAIWEAGGGAFQGYLSCELPAAAVKAARASSVAVARQGTITHVVCGYSQGIVFTHRAKGNCRVEGSGDCAADPSACRVRCD